MEEQKTTNLYKPMLQQPLILLLLLKDNNISVSKSFI